MVVSEVKDASSLLQAGRWSDARSAYEDALSKEITGEALFGLAEALWWLGDFRASISYYQRSYAAFREQGDAIGAVRACISLCFTYKSCLGNEAAASGWLAKAETEAKTVAPDLFQGWFWGLHGYMTIDHDLDQAAQFINRALSHARSTADRDLELVTLADLGLVLARSGKIDEGLQLVDEAMAGVSAGENRQLNTVVFVCCVMLVVCELASDLGRAKQWSSFAEQFGKTYSCPFLSAECRALYGSILVAGGRWAEAEQQLRSAIEITRDSFTTFFVLATGYLADLKLRQGFIEEAEQLLSGIERDMPAMLPLAAVKLARGQPRVAVALIERVLRNESLADKVASVRALELLVDAFLASDDPRAASETLSRLQATAGRACGRGAWRPAGRPRQLREGDGLLLFSGPAPGERPRPPRHRRACRGCQRGARQVGSSGRAQCLRGAGRQRRCGRGLRPAADTGCAY
ncbi:MAG: tetratricopeptide repeat protein [Dehalococcoidia bacterium]|nr:tetratricopeptide repeat protein [Dehalococcoidia bacterium]